MEADLSETPSVSGMSRSAAEQWRVVAKLVNTWLTLLVQSHSHLHDQRRARIAG
jgi:hypothetical protein